MVLVLVATVAKENFKEYLKEDNTGMRTTSASFSMLILISHNKLNSQTCAFLFPRAVISRHS